jgi:hypothetical protein
MEVTRLTLADILGTTPQSSRFRDLVASSRFYGLTTGGINSEEFALDDLGERATSDDDETRVAAYKAGVMRVVPFRAFFEAFASKKIPGAVAAKEFLTRNAGVPEGHAQDCINHILADAETAGFVREIGSARYVDLAGTPIVRDPTTDGHADEEPDDVADVAEGQVDPAYARGGNGNVPDPHPEPERPSAIFVGGKKGKSLTQLIAILDEYKIPHKEAEQEPNAGRPISQKVADTIKQCGAAIIVFTPDEELRDLDGNPVWRPSQNVVHELGAAGMQYGKRIVIFREETMTLASNYSDVGHITFKDGELSAKGIELFRELIEFGLVKVTVGV